MITAPPAIISSGSPFSSGRQFGQPSKHGNIHSQIIQILSDQPGHDDEIKQIPHPSFLILLDIGRCQVKKTLCRDKAEAVGFRRQLTSCRGRSRGQRAAIFVIATCYHRPPHITMTTAIPSPPLSRLLPQPLRLRLRLLWRFLPLLLLLHFATASSAAVASATAEPPSSC